MSLCRLTHIAEACCGTGSKSTFQARMLLPWKRVRPTCHPKEKSEPWPSFLNTNWLRTANAPKDAMPA